jgi:hypothetical protein
MIGVHILCFFSPLSNEVMRVHCKNKLSIKDIVDLFGFKTCGGDLLTLFAFATGLYYNLDNII